MCVGFFDGLAVVMGVNDVIIVESNVHVGKMVVPLDLSNGTPDGDSIGCAEK